ncbi:methyltransferase [Paenibacillus marinisediminis]
MSRSWERKVRKNSQTLNKQRQKTGKPALHIGEEKYEQFKGRNFILPIVLIAIALLFALVGSVPVAQGKQSAWLYWVTIFAYIGLGLIIFFRKPYLKIGKDYVSTTKWNRPRFLYVKDIKKITVQPGIVVIEKSGKGSNWVFSRLMNRYNIDEMGSGVIKFAEQHHIPYEKVSK